MKDIQLLNELMPMSLATSSVLGGSDQLINTRLTADAFFHHESASFENREARYRLSNRNRFIYLIPHLADPDFVDAFLAAERDYLVRPAFHEEVRAISGAAIDVLAHLPTISQRCLSPDADSQGIMRNARDVLGQIRQICLHTLSTARPSWTDAR